MTMIPYCGAELDQPELDPEPVSDDAIRLHQAEAENADLQLRLKALQSALAIIGRVAQPYYVAPKSARQR